jgi:hypothetical protein
MAEKAGAKGSGTVAHKPDSHPVVKALRDPKNGRDWQDSPDDFVRLVGYVGQCPQPGWVRLYHSPNDLSEYVDFRWADRLHDEEVPEASLSPGDLKGARYVWIRKDAMVMSGRMQPAAAESRYVEGEITLAHLRKAVRCFLTGDEKSRDLLLKLGDGVTASPC